MVNKCATQIDYSRSFYLFISDVLSLSIQYQWYIELQMFALIKRIERGFICEHKEWGKNGTDVLRLSSGTIAVRTSVGIWIRKFITWDQINMENANLVF